MKLQNVANQGTRHPLYRADGSITAGGTAQLVLGRSVSRSHLIIQNTSTGPLWLEIGCGRATATLTSGAVSSVSVSNAGFNYTKPPLVKFWGGGNNYGNTSWVGVGQPNMPPPNSVGPAGRIAAAHAVLVGGAISSIVVDDGGAGYTAAPYVEIINSDLDFLGCAVPSAGVGILLPAGSFPLIYNGSVCPTDPIAIFGATTGQTFMCGWMD